MKILTAFSNYKNSINPIQACETARETLEPQQHTIEFAPLTDGGEGFCEILTQQLNGNFENYIVKGPTFKSIEAKIGWAQIEQLPPEAISRLQISVSKGKLAIIEMALASGYECISDAERDAWKTSSFGTGELIQIATKQGADLILLGIGGSATNDCGSGALEALGVVYYDRELQPVKNLTPAKWKEVTSLGGMVHVGAQLPPIRIACDVENPLLGENGATSVYGPQKGVLPEDVDRFDRSMKKMAQRILGLFGKDPENWEEWLKLESGGAAGGIGFGLKAASKNVKFVKGFELCSEITELKNKTQRADIVLTGEGRLDTSSLSGKGPFSLLSLISKDQKVYFLPGSTDLDTKNNLEIKFPNLKILELSEPNWDLETALANTKAQIAKRLRELNL